MNDKFSTVCQKNKDMPRNLKHSYWVFWLFFFLQSVTFRNFKVNLVMFPFIVTILSTSIPQVWRGCDYYLLFYPILLLYINPTVSKHCFTSVEVPHTSVKLLCVLQICCNHSSLNSQPIWNPTRWKRLIWTVPWELSIYFPPATHAICLFFSSRLFSSGST